MRWPTARRHWVTIALATAAIAAGITIWAAWPHARETPRARQYLTYTACLLTDATGISGPSAPVWAGMQDVSLQRHIKISYLAVPNPQTDQNVTPYLNTLLQRQCNAIITTGATQTQAAIRAAPQHPQIAFLIVGTAQPATNLTPIPTTPTNLRTAVRAALDTAAKAAH